jgi:hypothetical protein
MGGPDWLADGFAALMLLTAAYCTSRLLVARRLHRVVETDVELVHIAMGVVMAGMLVAALQFVPNGLAEVVFALATLWFAWRAIEAIRRSGRGWTGGHHAVPHVVLSGAMFYMVAAQPSSPMAAMTSMSQSVGHTVQFAPLGAILAIVLFGYAIWYANRLAPAGAAEAFELAGVRATDASHRVSSAGERAADPQPGGAPARAPRAPDPPAGDPFLAPRLGMCCHIAMCITMGYMLIAML